MDILTDILAILFTIISITVIVIATIAVVLIRKGRKVVIRVTKPKSKRHPR